MWRTPNNNNILLLDLILINCEIELDWSWSNECIISQVPITHAVADNPPTQARQTTDVTF